MADLESRLLLPNFFLKPEDFQPSSPKTTWISLPDQPDRLWLSLGDAEHIATGVTRLDFQKLVQQVRFSSPSSEGKEEKSQRLLFLSVRRILEPLDLWPQGMPPPTQPIKQGVTLAIAYLLVKGIIDQAEARNLLALGVFSPVDFQNQDGNRGLFQEQIPDLIFYFTYFQKLPVQRNPLKARNLETLFQIALYDESQCAALAFSLLERGYHLHVAISSIKNKKSEQKHTLNRAIKCFKNQVERFLLKPHLFLDKNFSLKNKKKSVPDFSLRHFLVFECLLNARIFIAIDLALDSSDHYIHLYGRDMVALCFSSIWNAGDEGEGNDRIFCFDSKIVDELYQKIGNKSLSIFSIKQGILVVQELSSSLPFHRIVRKDSQVPTIVCCRLSVRIIVLLGRIQEKKLWPFHISFKLLIDAWVGFEEANSCLEVACETILAFPKKKEEMKGFFEAFDAKEIENKEALVEALNELKLDFQNLVELGENETKAETNQESQKIALNLKPFVELTSPLPQEEEMVELIVGDTDDASLEVEKRGVIYSFFEKIFF